MTRFSFTYDGKNYTNFTQEEAAEAGVPIDVLEGELKKANALEGRRKIRSNIASNVGDVESILGTVADASGVLIALSLARISALASAKSADLSAAEKAELAAIKGLAGDADLAALSASALGKLQSGEAVLTATLKGLDGVIQETLARSTGVATILQSAAAGAEEGEG